MLAVALIAGIGIWHLTPKPTSTPTATPTPTSTATPTPTPTPAVPSTDKANAEYHDQRGVAFERQGNRADAVAEFTAAIQSNPNSATAYYHRSNVYTELGQIDKAANDLAAARQLELVSTPTNVETLTTEVEANANVHYHRGVASEGQGNRADAIAEFTAAIRSNPNFAAACYHRSNVYTELGQIDKAANDLAAARQLDGK